MRKSLGLFHVLHVPVNLRTVFSAVAIFSSLLTTQASADYVYNIVNYPALQIPYTLSGQIVTDINSGTLSFSNVDSWSWTVTGGSPYTATSSDPLSGFNWTGSVDITPTEISLPLPPSSGAGNSFYFFDSSGAFLQWSLSPNPPQPPYQKYEAYGPYSLNHVHYWLAENSAPLYTTTVPWVIATAQSTPEPATLTLLASGFLAIGWFGLRKRRRAA
jgi:hypothetical protein